MSNPTSQKQHSRMLPFPVIVAASGGDTDAIKTVLKHYEGYIVALSARRLYDEDGNPHLFIDEELRREIETKIIAKILTFSVA
jgi:hypothetical protein